MKIVLLGTGTPAPSLRRAGSSYLVDLGESVLLFDAGPGACRRLMEAGYRATDVTHMVFSHLHYDHCLDYAQLVLTRWDQGAGRIPELEVVGPAHTARMTGLLFDADGVFGPDLAARTRLEPSIQVYEARGGVRPRRGPAPAVREIGNGSVVEGAGWTLKAAAVPHAQPWLDCFGFRLDAPGGSFAYSGDCGPSRSFARLAGGGRRAGPHGLSGLGHRARPGMDAGRGRASRSGRDCRPRRGRDPRRQPPFRPDGRAGRARAPDRRNGRGLWRQRRLGRGPDGGPAVRPAVGGHTG